MTDIVFTLELSDDGANSLANDYLEKGWTLISVGPKTTSVYNEQLYYSTAYVLGATRKQYEKYLSEEINKLI